ncbi:MAG: tetratricopeptide repeat protein, partial [Planctomycetota bacterium]
MLRPARFTLALTACAALLAAGPATAEEMPGQADLNKAMQLKVAVGGDRGVRRLSRVIGLLDSALEKGLEESDESFASEMLVATLLDRGSARAQAVLRGRITDPRRDPTWVQARQLALGDLQRVVELDGSVVEAHLLIGRLQTLPLGDPAAARRSLTKVIEADTVEDEQRAQAYALRGAAESDPEKQAADYAKATDLMPTKAEYLLLRGQAALRRDDLAGATAAIDKAIEVAPGNAKVYELQGMLFRRQKKADEAIAALDKATENDPSSIAPYQYRPELYSVQGDRGRAIEELTKAIELAPNNLASPLIRSELYAAEERYEDALRDVESVLRRQPGLVRAHLLRTSLLGRLGREEEALGILQQLADAAPDQPEIQLQLAGYYMDAGKSAEAIAALSRVIEIAGDASATLRMRGDMYLSTGDHKLALADFAKAYELQPDDAGMLNNYAWTLATSPFDDLRDGAKAVELATRACEITEYQAAHILSTLAAAYAEAGDFAKAIEWSQKAVKAHAADEATTRDMTAELAAELASYQANRPWRELQKDGTLSPAGDEAEEPSKEAAAPAAVPSLD